MVNQFGIILFSKMIDACSSSIFFKYHKVRLAIASQYFNDTPVNNLALFCQAKIKKSIFLLSKLLCLQGFLKNPVGLCFYRGEADSIRERSDQLLTLV